jgi:hypothetical protein
LTDPSSNICLSARFAGRFAARKKTEVRINGTSVCVEGVGCQPKLFTHGQPLASVNSGRKVTILSTLNRGAMLASVTGQRPKTQARIKARLSPISESEPDAYFHAAQTIPLTEPTR